MCHDSSPMALRVGVTFLPDRKTDRHTVTASRIIPGSLTKLNVNTETFLRPWKLRRFKRSVGQVTRDGYTRSVGCTSHLWWLYTECRLYKSLVMVIHGVSVGQVTCDGYTRSVGCTSHLWWDMECRLYKSLVMVIHGVSVVQVTP